MWAVSLGRECTALSPGTELLVIIRSWLGYLDNFEDRGNDVNSVFVLHIK